MKTRRSSVVTAMIWLAVTLCMASAAVDAAAVVPAESAEPAAGFDWRAFLAPFHSVVLHLPIGFVTMALILEIYSFFNPGKSMRRAVGLVLGVSVASAVVTALLGYLRSGGGGYEKNALTLHQWAGIAVTVSICGAAFLHLLAFPWNGKRRLVFASLYRMVLVVTVVLLSIAGHYGGNLTHGSKYLFANAPEWVGALVEDTEDRVTDTIAETIGLELVADSPLEAVEAGGGSGVYAEVLRPIFEKNCFKCHGPDKQKGDYRMDTVEDMFTPGDSEFEVIVPGRPLESYLVEVLTLPRDDDYSMPPDGKEPLTPEETLAVIRWIWDGAHTGDGDAVSE